MKDTECPYCGKDQEICTDDGYGMEEGETYSQACADCGKTFVFTTTIIIRHDAYEAPCLNGAPHNMQPIKGAPTAFFVGKTRCTCCGEEAVDKAANEAAMAAYFAPATPAAPRSHGERTSTAAGTGPRPRPSPTAAGPGRRSCG